MAIHTAVVDGKRCIVTISTPSGKCEMVEQEVERRSGDRYWRIMWEHPDPIKPRIQKIIDAVLRGGR